VIAASACDRPHPSTPPPLTQCGASATTNTSASASATTGDIICAGGSMPLRVTSSGQHGRALSCIITPALDQSALKQVAHAMPLLFQNRLFLRLSCLLVPPPQLLCLVATLIWKRLWRVFTVHHLWIALWLLLLLLLLLLPLSQLRLL